jgi:hypothetical protein
VVPLLVPRGGVAQAHGLVENFTAADHAPRV